MRYGNRLKLHTSREHPYPGESSLLRTLPWAVDVLYQPNKELSQSRNNLQPGSYGYSIETGQFQSPAPHAANDYRLIAAYPCRRLSNKYRNMTSSGPIVKTERYCKKTSPSIQRRLHIPVQDPIRSFTGIREATYQSNIEISPGWGSKEFRIPRPSCGKSPCKKRRDTVKSEPLHSKTNPLYGPGSYPDPVQYLGFVLSTL